MLRFTFFVWERVKEDKNLFNRPKIDTVREIVVVEDIDNSFMDSFLS